MSENEVKKAKHNVKTVLRSAMKACQEKGVNIANHAWGAHIDPTKGYFVAEGSNRVCALGALLVHKNGSIKFEEFLGHRAVYEATQEETAAYVLGVDRSWVEAFIRGFDNKGAYVSWSKEHKRAYRLGVELRKEFGL